MFAQLSAVIDELDVPVDGSAIRELLALRDRLDAKVSAALVEFDRLELWDLDGATSLTAWLRDQGCQSRRTAGRVSAVARRLRKLPVTAAAWRDGRLSAGQVEAIVANTNDATVERFAANETELVDLLVPLSVDDTTTAMQRWRALAQGDAPPDDDTDAVHLSPTLDGRWRLDGDLNAADGVITSTALRVADSNDPNIPAPQRRADALVTVCQFFLDNQHTHTGGRHRPHVNIIVDHDHAHAVGGPDLDPITTAVLLCDSILHRLDMAGSVILDYGRATRTIPTPLWNAIVARDQHCRFPGCDRPANWCDAHHVLPWEHGGTTDPHNLASS